MTYEKGFEMEELTLVLKKSKETKNKVVYGTQDGSVIQSVYIDKDALGQRASGNAPGGHFPTVSQRHSRFGLPGRARWYSRGGGAVRGQGLN